MKVITDYLGNEVKEGQEICLIQVIDRQHFRYTGYILDGKLQGTPEPVRPDKPCWLIKQYKEVHKNEEHEYLYVVEEGENYIGRHSVETLIAFSDMNINILAIKGISDKEELYLR